MDFFQSPNPAWLIMIPYGMALLSVSYLRIELVPYLLYGPISEYILGFIKILHNDYNIILAAIFYVSWILHIGEGLYAYHIAGKPGMSLCCRLKWGLQTFILGFPSLSILKQYVARKAALTKQK